MSGGRTCWLSSPLSYLRRNTMSSNKLPSSRIAPVPISAQTNIRAYSKLLAATHTGHLNPIDAFLHSKPVNSPECRLWTPLTRPLSTPSPIHHELKHRSSTHTAKTLEQGRMGNICSRSKNEPEAFTTPGRVLGSSTTNNNSGAPRASVPAGTKSKQSNWESPGRTLGGGGGSGSAGSSTGPGTETAEDARARAAAAAQARAEATTANKGKLGTKLAAQKAQTQSQTLQAASRDERAARDADGAEAARRWE
ncbi:hypothetical protein BJX63DRAFT_384904 [Aspergillus granulosus]|uniref:Uncharacterized protein n=1 Tax=Aspergillus granulosus TaxID=176169 RepID=A0ABR4HQM7_9EURO